MRFALFCKSFRDDLERFRLLLDSVERHNQSALPLFVSVPRADKQLFRDNIGSRRVELVTDEEILGRELDQSWRVQQLVKLYASRLKFADAWLVVDSDSYFVRPFSLADFVDAEGRVGFVANAAVHALDEFPERVRAYLDTGVLPGGSWADSPLAPKPPATLGTLPWYQNCLDAVARPTHDQRLLRIQRFFERRGPPLFYMPGSVWTAECLAAMEAELLRPRGLTFEKLIRFSPWECVWVGEWEIFRGMPRRFLAQAYLLHVATDAAILRARAEGLTESMLAERYLGVQLAARHQQLLSL